MATSRSNAQLVKEALSMYQVAEFYGFEPNRAGFVACPFHPTDNTPSLKVYRQPGGGFHCHACGAGSSVIDFVMRLFELSYAQALVRLSADFHLGLSTERPDARAVERLRRERATKERAQAAFRRDYESKCREHRALWESLQGAAPVTEAEGQQRAEALARLDYLRAWFDQHPYK